jgi:arsenate reductase (glutaredoxin)
MYYNPACSKCRTAQSLLIEQGVDAEMVRYLDRPPDREELLRLMEMLGISDPRLMMRTAEATYEELGLAHTSGDALLEAIEAHPILLERPIFVRGGRAVIARPPERIQELL